ncbi:branched-chain amino acid aminotransferase [Salmonella enterica subsp. enterica serovar Sanjuan]|uniref:branched-chain-amino-acid transaminase n=1 Tax=Salmonella enterica subsp. enterica serovar Sanjuan TaxID=1160765 RepID=A0A3S5DC79_SALET|nr:branched-chain amino acid aminotransferase [Salmonella enterica subsp. enterica serovar Sanjuan]
MACCYSAVYLFRAARHYSRRDHQLAKELGIEVREQVLSRESLYLADEVFMSGTAAEITPVRSVDGIQVGEGRCGPVTKRIQQAFFGLFTGETEDKWGWLDPVNS